MSGEGLRLLVVDGNTRPYTAEKIAHGGSAAGEQYALVLASLGHEVACRIIHPADDDYRGLPENEAPGDFDGAVWTGSGLSLCAPSEAVTRQVELARALFASGVPVFGSCWGLQVAAVALGGSVRRNPRGREIGIARRIACTASGMAHPMYARKPKVFDAIAVHLDEVESLPPGGRALAQNRISAIQAAEITCEARRISFWGVQYHPEYDFLEIASSLRRAGSAMVADRQARSLDELERYAGELVAMQDEPGRTDLAWRHGVDETVLDVALRRAEIRAWLDFIAARPQA
ncbi:MAG: type 1 glutamine amidotransferase [Burkholderiaceae bacterium]